MKAPRFVHLHAHSEYSLLDGACRIKDLVELARKCAMPALALTDHGNLFGAIEFYQQAIKAGVKPILGYEAYVAPGKMTDRETRPGTPPYFHLTLLVRNDQGYKNLLRLASLAYQKGFYYRPRIDKELLAAHREGLLALSGCLSSELCHRAKLGQWKQAAEVVGQYQEILGAENFFLEIQRHGLKEQEELLAGLYQLGQKTGAPLVATNDVHYVHKDEARAHDVLLCISTNQQIAEEHRLKMGSHELYFKRPEEMASSFADFPEALENTLLVADRCNLELRFGQPHLPAFSPPEGKLVFDHLRELCAAGLSERYPEVTGALRYRLEKELTIIELMGFSGYFLIVWDMVRFARERGIPVGPGRGSAAGSLVAYSLGITDIDPIRYGLLFERFLNASRNELPDIDIDFCEERRAEVIEYIKKKYGSENVAQIITFGTMAARAVLRDVGRALGVPLAEVDRIAKKVPPVPKIKLKEAMEMEPELRGLYEERQDLRELFDVSMKLEGLSRNASTHAAGVVVSDRPLTEYAPVYVADGMETTQYPMQALQEIGLLKMDLLGLSTLTILDKAVRMIRETGGTTIDLRALPPNDTKTFEILRRAETKGIFQLESSGMRDLLFKMRPERFEDLIALLALFRPGPLQSGMVEQYIAGRNGDRPIAYLHTLLEPILQETGGLILYQEQVMLIADKLGGFTLVDADSLRKAMGKKKPEIMARYREQFIEGAAKHGVDGELATQIFGLMEHFGGYGFNKSHSAAYARISYETAYLKANHPLEYMAAVLTVERGDTDKLSEYIQECRRMKIPVLPPDVNESEREFRVVGVKIRFGLGAVKNLGDRTVDALLEARAKGGRFRDLFDFCERVDNRCLDRSGLEGLIRAGAFGSTGKPRAYWMAHLERVLEWGSSRQEDRRRGQLDFFGSPAAPSSAPVELPADQIAEWPEEQILAYEKQYLGDYLSGHPLLKYQPVMVAFSTVTTAGLRELEEGREVLLAGVLSELSTAMIKSGQSRGQKMAKFRLRDLEGAVDAVIFPSELERLKPYLGSDAVVFARGRLDLRREVPSLRVTDVIPMERALQELAAGLEIALGPAGADRVTLEQVRDLLVAHPGSCPVFLKVEVAGGEPVEIRVGQDFLVSPSARLLSEIEGILGTGHVRLVGRG